MRHLDPEALVHGLLREGAGERVRHDHGEAAGGDGANRWYKVTLKEGRNREVRRLWAAAGFEVSRLIRTGYGPVELPRKLRRGKYEALTPGQVRVLYAAAGLPLPDSMKRRAKKKRKYKKTR